VAQKACEESVSGHIARGATKLSDCARALDDTARIACLERLAVGAPAEACGALQDEVLAQTCLDVQLDTRARADDDMSACGAIVGPDRRRACEDAVLEATARRSKDLAGCRKIKAEAARARCSDGIRFDQAVESLNDGACRLVRDGAKRATCRQQIVEDQAQEQMDPGRCARLPTLGKSRCEEKVTAWIVARAGTDSDCEKIRGEDQRARCLGAFTTREAVKASDGARCDALAAKAPVERQRCLDTVAKGLGVRDLDLERCRVVVDGTMRSDCELRVASGQALRDDSLKRCEILPAADRARCLDPLLERRAVKSADAAQCDAISQSWLRERCKATLTKP
jgi:hypothetical protein